MAKNAGLALLIKMGKKKPSSDDGMGDDMKDGMDSSPDMGGGPSDDMDSGSMPGGAEDEKTSIATDDLAESMGIPDDKRADFAAAFKNAVQACMKSSY